MRFPNAAKGLKKIFTAEILNLIGAILMVIMAGVLVGSLVAGKIGNTVSVSIMGGGLVGVGVLFIAAMVLGIIAFIMNLVGVINANHDESNFKSALIFLIISIIASVLAGVFTSNGMVSSLMRSLSTLMSLFVTIFVISGSIKLADQLNRGDVSTSGTNVLKMIIVVKVIELIVSLIVSFMGGMVASVVACILFLASVILNIIQYFMYLSFLNKAKKMLNE